MCSECEASLASVTKERDQLLVIVGAAMKVMGPAQFAEMRAEIAGHDAGGDSAV
jgi:hypothetical protein